MALPYVNYLFIPLFSVLLLYFLVKFFVQRKKSGNVSYLIKVFLPFLIICGIIILAYVFSEQRNILTFKDIMHIGILLSIIFMGYTGIQNLEEYNKFSDYFVIQVIVSSGFISVIGLVKYIITLSGISIDFTNDIPLFNSAMNRDYNFFSLSIILGILSVIYLLVTRRITKKTKILLQVLLFLMTLNVLFSTSRRGFIFLLVFLVFITLLNLNFFRESIFHNQKLRLFTALTLIFLVFQTFYVATFNSKLFLNFKRTDFNVNFVNYSLFDLAYKYGSVFGLKRNTVDRIINIEYDSKYPYTRWGFRIHEEVYPLAGQNSGIVPRGTVGYKIDKRSNSDTWSGNAYSYTPITCLYKEDTSNLIKDVFQASVYCFVSEDFNGTWVSIAAEGNSFGTKRMEYDMNNKNLWQKLSINFQTTNGIPPAYLYLSKVGVTDFNNLKGYVIFAYPEYIKSIESDSVAQSINKGQAISNYINASFVNYIKIIKIGRKIRQEFFSGVNAADSIPADTFLITSSDVVTHARTERWKYGYYIFMQEYSFVQKVFGKGFEYMNKFGRKFRETDLDYPHNPFIDAFLYSGIAGGIIYLWFMFLVFLNYKRFLRHHLYFFLCFIVVFLFSFVSANTHFSIPVFTFLSMVPFMTKYFVDREGNTERVES